MKCDTCRNQKHESFSEGSEDWCARGHWDGIGDPNDPCETYWDDCHDYEEEYTQDAG